MPKYDKNYPGFLEYVFIVSLTPREKRATFWLPADLTRKEVERIQNFIGTLCIEPNTKSNES